MSGTDAKASFEKPACQMSAAHADSLLSDLSCKIVFGHLQMTHDTLFRFIVYLWIQFFQRPHPDFYPLSLYGVFLARPHMYIYMN